MKIVTGIFLSVLFAVFMPSFLSLDGPSKDAVNTLFTVVGVIFSVGMSLIISVSTSGVKNKEARAIFRSQLKSIRSKFIWVFVILSLCYVLMPLDDNSKLVEFVEIHDIQLKASFNIFMTVSLLLSIVYYIVNFYSIQSSVYEMEDRIDSGN